MIEGMAMSVKSRSHKTILGPDALHRELAKWRKREPKLQDKYGYAEYGFIAGFITAAKIAQDELWKQGIRLP
jgi:hypothetical protein